MVYPPPQPPQPPPPPQLLPQLLLLQLLLLQLLLLQLLLPPLVVDGGGLSVCFNSVHTGSAKGREAMPNKPTA